MSWPLLNSAFHDVLKQHPIHISFRKRGGSGPGTLDRVGRVGVGVLSDSVRLTHTGTCTTAGKGAVNAINLISP